MLLDYPEVQFFFKMRIFLFTAQFLAYTNTNIPTLPIIWESHFFSRFFIHSMVSGAFFRYYFITE